MHVIHITRDHTTADGSHSSDVDIPLEAQVFAEGVPPLLVSEAYAAHSVRFAEFPDDVRDTEPHRTPRRQFAVVLGGAATTQTTDGEIRTLTAGSVGWLEDTEGIGHVTRVLEAPFRVMFVALEPDGER